MRYMYMFPCLECHKLVRRSNARKFLCSVCRKTSYPKEFREISKEMRKKGECIICGTNKNLHVHHIDKNRNNNDLKNLEIRCSQCHQSKHRTNDKKHIKIKRGILGNRIIYK